MSDTQVILPPDEPVIVIERIFDAPRALVFRVFTDPFHLVHFWGPHGSTNPVCEMDVRPGGIWRQVMRFPNGQEYETTSVYVEVVEPERIVWRDAPAEKTSANAPPHLLTTVRLEDLGKRTKLIAQIRAVSIAERDETVRRGFANVVSQAYERLDAYLPTLRARAGG